MDPMVAVNDAGRDGVYINAVIDEIQTCRLGH